MEALNAKIPNIFVKLNRPDNKDRPFTMRMGADDYRRLTALATQYHISRSDIIRQLIKGSFDKMVIDNLSNIS